MGMFCPLHSLMETVKSTNLDFSNKLSMKMIKGMMTSDFWRVISEVIRGGELLTRGRSESKLTRHKGQFLSSFANNPSPPPLERCKVITEQCAKSIGQLRWLLLRSDAVIGATNATRRQRGKSA